MVRDRVRFFVRVSVQVMVRVSVSVRVWVRVRVCVRGLTLKAFLKLSTLKILLCPP